MARLVLAAAVLLTGATAQSVAGCSPGTRLNVTIDAGSTGSRVLAWCARLQPVHLQRAMLRLTFVPLVNAATSAGIATAQGRAQLPALLATAAVQITAAGFGLGELSLKATGVIRTLTAAERFNAMAEVTAMLANSSLNSGFSFARGDASVISGEEEGVAAWMAAQDASSGDRWLSGTPGTTLGIVDVGTSSAQVAFETPGGLEVLQQEQSLQLYSLRRRLYAASHAGFGVDEVTARVNELVLLDAGVPASGATVPHPCFPPGVNGAGVVYDSAVVNGRVTFTGGNNATRCREYLRALLHKSAQCFTDGRTAVTASQFRVLGLVEPAVNAATAAVLRRAGLRVTALDFSELLAARVDEADGRDGAAYPAGANSSCGIGGVYLAPHALPADVARAWPAGQPVPAPVTFLCISPACAATYESLGVPLEGAPLDALAAAGERFLNTTWGAPMAAAFPRLQQALGAAAARTGLAALYLHTLLTTGLGVPGSDATRVRSANATALPSFAQGAAALDANAVAMALGLASTAAPPPGCPSAPPQAGYDAAVALCCVFAVALVVALWWIVAPACAKRTCDRSLGAVGLGPGRVRGGVQLPVAGVIVGGARVQRPGTPNGLMNIVVQSPLVGSGGSLGAAGGAKGSGEGALGPPVPGASVLGGRVNLRSGGTLQAATEKQAQAVAGTRSHLAAVTSSARVEDASSTLTKLSRGDSGRRSPMATWG